MKLRMEALYGHPAENEGELAFRHGDLIYCDDEEVVDSDWRYGMKNGKIGLVPHVLLKPAAIYVGQYLLIFFGSLTMGDHFNVFTLFLRLAVRAQALHTYDTDSDDELAFMQGDIILVEPKPKNDDDWWYGEFNGRIGLFPKHFVKVLQRFQGQLKNKQKNQNTLLVADLLIFIFIFILSRVFPVKAHCIEGFKAFRFDQVSCKKGDIMLVEKYEPSGGEYLYVEFGHRAGLVPSKHIEILNIQKGCLLVFFFFFFSLATVDLKQTPFILASPSQGIASLHSKEERRDQLQ